jgi:hypothetical protein
MALLYSRIPYGDDGNEAQLERCETSKRMLTQDITLAGDSSSTRVYAQTAGPTETSNSSIRKAPAATGELESLTVKHSTSSRNGTVVKRHLARLDLGKVNSTSQKQQVASVYVVMEVPQDTVITSAQISDMTTQLKNLLSAGNVTKLLNDEA